MGKSTNRAIMNEHARRYIEEFWADRLRAEGFSCAENNILCWYRVVNGEVLHFLSFCSVFHFIPLHLCISYAAFPLIFQPTPNRSVASRSPSFFGHGICMPLVEMNVRNNGQIRPDLLIYGPQGGTYGVAMLEERILPYLDQVRTLETCYQMHRNRYINKSVEPHVFYHAPSTLTEFALWVGDTEFYPLYVSEIERAIKYFETRLEQTPDKPEIVSYIQYWQRMKSAFENTDNGAVLKELEQRKKKTIRWLQKMGIPLE